jgi:DNA gyrase subunit B
LTPFSRYFPQLITGIHIYIAQPPLFRIHMGKEIRYAFSEQDRDKMIDELQKIKTERSKVKSKKGVGAQDSAPEEEVEAQEEGAEGEEGVVKVGGIAVSRYKGLGEMNPEQLWSTTMDPLHRMMKVVNINDAEEADATFDSLMGSEVATRKKFIQTHAKNAEVDI